MTTKSVLVTGGAGFIGSHLTRALLGQGHHVRILDNLDPQAHAGKPGPHPQGTELMQGDLRDRQTIEEALRDVEIVFHEAAAVGIGQSMYQVRRYVEVNSLGTSNLLDLMANSKHDVERLVVASSNTVYGEGRYLCPKCGPVSPPIRETAQLHRKEWELCCGKCGSTVTPAPTDEDKPLHPANVYAVTKRDQEELCLVVGRAYGIPAIALRYFNVLGPGQSLSNPYTGVYAIFLSRIRQGNPPVIYEDGKQTRDFVSVHDVVQANMLALKRSGMDYGSFNVGTGRAVTIEEVAQRLLAISGVDLEPQITGGFRAGDVRHCHADISRISAHGYSPRVSFEEALEEFCSWSRDKPTQDLFEEAAREMDSRGLVR